MPKQPGEQRYTLEIYEPDSIDDVAAVWESDTPFGAISKGDIITPLLVPAEDRERVLRVVRIEHMIWETDVAGLKHKVCIYTAAEPNKKVTRFS